MMKKILVIDDSKTVRTLCEWMYKGLEDKILTAESATSANGIIQNESPDVIFVDYTLPDADAYEFIATHAALGRALVLLGGSYAPCDADKAKSQGAVDVLVKPFKTADFFDSVERASTTPVRVAQPARPVAVIPQTAPISTPASSSNRVIPSVAPAPKRFNFPGSAAAPAASSAPSTPPVPQATVSKSAPKIDAITRSPVSEAAASTSSPSGALATPKTPVPSISPAVQQAEAAKQIDPAILRAEVIAAVKDMLPAIVNSYLKKLIQAEVKPQLQNWVDARVEALIKKMMQ